MVHAYIYAQSCNLKTKIPFISPMHILNWFCVFLKRNINFDTVSKKKTKLFTLKKDETKLLIFCHVYVSQTGF